MSKHLIGYELTSEDMGSLTRPVQLDINKLVVSRALIQASSGSGKSYLMRRILEQTFGTIQQIVIDVEGEFSSLREKYDYVLGAKDGGETSVDPRAAALLATRLLELNVSAILDVYELRDEDRLLFVKNFIDSMINAPRKLWHPVIIAIDEAHKFCPQSHEVESSEAIMALCSRGRKRGFCPILATQRLSKLHKDAAAECLNKFIGKTQLDLDVRRASDDLGFASKVQRHELRRLHPGEFFAFGPAVTVKGNDSGAIVKMKGAEVLTTHPKAGGRIQKYKPPPPTKRIKALLPSLADLPAEAEEKEATKREMVRSIARLERENASMKDIIAKPPPVRIVQMIKPGIVTRLEQMAKRMTAQSAKLGVAAERMQDTASRLTIKPAEPDATPETIKEQVDMDIKRLTAQPVHLRILAALKYFPGSDARRVASLINVSPTRSTFRYGTMRLRQEELITGERAAYFLTKKGEDAAQDIPALPVRGAYAVAYWRKRIGGGVPDEVFSAILKAGTAGISKDEIEKETEVDTNKSTFRIAIATLRTFGLITGDIHAYYIKESLL